MDMIIASCGDSDIILDAEVSGFVTVTEDTPEGEVKADHPLFDITSLRAVRSVKKPVLTKRGQQEAKVVGPRESAGVIVATVDFSDGSTETVSFDEAQNLLKREQFGRKKTNVQVSGVSVGWSLQAPTKKR